MANNILKRILSSKKGSGCLDSLFGVLHCVIDTGTKAINLISTGVRGRLQEILDTLIEITKVLPKLEIDENEPEDEPEEDPDEDEQSSTSSCSVTTVSSCLVGCSETVTTIADSASLTTVCYTTSCGTTTGCDLEQTTTSSIETLSASACPLAFERYDAQLTADTYGTAMPFWPDSPPLLSEYATSTEASTTSTQTSTPAPSTTTPSAVSSSDSSTLSFSFVPDPTTSTSIAPSISATILPDFRDLKHLGDITRKCYDPSKFHGHGDIHDGNVNMFSDDVCKEFGDLELTPESKPFIHRERASHGDQINIYFVVS
ncbi:hypothetical protein CBER1_03554 [Cercospora berteroae]|uniref:Uncharacterized protein n=1 Tax=Cercospora berteroae TaxID=357750 RepID=A0A2S6CFU1_9PEZI|nr:hypothetical protein CBER1_03554 [Cercospora berteroae]